MGKINNTQLKVINDLDATLRYYIEAAEGEDYSPAITKDKDTFKQLIKLEAKTERQFAGYFKNLGDKLIETINWSAYNSQIKAANTDILITGALKLLEDEQKILVSLAFGTYTEGIGIGLVAGGNLYNMPLNLANVQSKVDSQALKASNALVKDVNNTTRDKLRSNLRTSLALGEDVEAAQIRIMNTLNDPGGFRSRAIARTEPVNSYGQGTLLFGQETGAKGKVISAVIDKRTSPICRELNERYGSQSHAQKMDKPYIWYSAGGGSSDAPGFHVNCRTGHYLLY